MSSENPIRCGQSAGKARSMLELDRWVVGFVDGEGCFSVSIVRNPSVVDSAGKSSLSSRVYQHATHRACSKHLIAVLRVRHVSSRRPTTIASVCDASPSTRSRDLEDIVIPFFEQHPLRIAKRDDFDRFARSSAMMQARSTSTEVRAVVGSPRDERERQATKPSGRRDPGDPQRLHARPSRVTPLEVKIQSDPHGDIGSQAEMT